MPKRVLVIGYDPKVLDFSTPERVQAGVTMEKVLAGIKMEGERIRAMGYELDQCLIAPGPTAEPLVLEHLNKHSYDCVLVGAGVRTSPDSLLLFEQIINLVHQHAPAARICFSSSPKDSTDAIRRWI